MLLKCIRCVSLPYIYVHNIGNKCKKSPLKHNLYVVSMVTGNKTGVWHVKYVSLNMQYVFAPHIFTGMFLNSPGVKKQLVKLQRIAISAHLLKWLPWQH